MVGSVIARSVVVESVIVGRDLDSLGRRVRPRRERV